MVCCVLVVSGYWFDCMLGVFVIFTYVGDDCLFVLRLLFVVYLLFVVFNFVVFVFDT